LKNILLSIKNKYVEAILKGNKVYEFRGWIWKEDVTFVYIYSSGKIKKIIARFKVNEILKEKPIKIWELCHNKSGVTQNEYFKYINTFGYETIYAIKIDSLQILNNGQYIDLHKIKIKNAPQKFKYLTDIENDVLERLFNE